MPLFGPRGPPLMSLRRHYASELIKEPIYSPPPQRPPRPQNLHFSHTCEIGHLVFSRTVDSERPGSQAFASHILMSRRRDRRVELFLWWGFFVVQSVHALFSCVAWWLMVVALHWSCECAGVSQNRCMKDGDSRFLDAVISGYGGFHWTWRTSAKQLDNGKACHTVTSTRLN